MKVSDIFRSNVDEVSEQNVIERIKKFDWKYQFSEDISRLPWGNRELQMIEALVYKFYKLQPEKAVAIWNEHSPESPQDKSITPSFILRLMEQDTQK